MLRTFRQFGSWPLSLCALRAAFLSRRVLGLRPNEGLGCRACLVSPLALGVLACAFLKSAFLLLFWVRGWFVFCGFVEGLLLCLQTSHYFFPNDEKSNQKNHSARKKSLRSLHRSLRSKNSPAPQVQTVWILAALSLCSSGGFSFKAGVGSATQLGFRLSCLLQHVGYV